MKQRLGVITMATMLLFQAASFRAQPAQAFALAPPAGVVGGVLLVFIGGTQALMGLLVRAWEQNDDYYAITGVGLGFAAIGLVLLDEESGTPSFGPLSPSLITGAGLTEDEVMAYQLELPELNQALFAGAAALASQGVTTAVEAFAHEEVWRHHAAGLMPETRSALTKIGDYFERF